MVLHASLLLSDWSKGSTEHFVAKVIYDFRAERPEELSIKTDQHLILAPKDRQPRVRGWMLASDGNTTGLVPANYVKVLGRKNSKNQKKPDLLPSNGTPVAKTSEFENEFVNFTSAEE